MQQLRRNVLSVICTHSDTDDRLYDTVPSLYAIKKKSIIMQIMNETVTHLNTWKTHSKKHCNDYQMYHHLIFDHC